MIRALLKLSQNDQVVAVKEVLINRPFKEEVVIVRQQPFVITTILHEESDPILRCIVTHVRDTFTDAELRKMEWEIL